MKAARDEALSVSKDTQNKRWLDRLEDVWTLQPGIRRDLRTLHRIAAQAEGSAIKGYDDFRRKLNGNRLGSADFLLAVYLAADLRRFGISFGDWTGDDDIWSARITEIEVHRLSLLVGLVSSKISFRIDILPRHASIADQGGEGKRSRVPVVKSGQSIDLSIQLNPGLNLYAAHLILLEHRMSDDQWRVMRSVEGRGICHKTPIQFEFHSHGFGAQISLENPLGSNAGHYVYAIMSQEPFERCIEGILDKVDARYGFISPTDLARIVSLIIPEYRRFRFARVYYLVER